jgi:hemerythrin-like domain-containing protein
MHEHRLIERMIDLLGREAKDIEKGNVPRMDFLCQAVDFISTYADKLHHGKEEDILFKRLEAKDLSEEHKQTMNRLVEDHKRGRKMVSDLREYMDQYGEGFPEARDRILDVLKDLTAMYPDHIDTEDNKFFHPVMDYFSQEEMDEMLSEYEEVIKSLVDDKYTLMVQSLEGDMDQK